MNTLVKTEPRAPAHVPDLEPQQYLTFLLGGEMFAIAIRHTKEIIRYGQLTLVPMMPSFIRGVINLRGAVVPVVDLAGRFGGRSAEVTRRTCIVILELEAEDGAQVLGLVVEAVSEVLEIAADAIRPPPAFGTRVRADFIAGMGQVGERFVIILDAARVLSAEELALAGQAA
jgi:purine-binding chemotaxis protein CheW